MSCIAPCRSGRTCRRYFPAVTESKTSGRVGIPGSVMTSKSGKRCLSSTTALFHLYSLLQDTQTFIERCLGALGPSRSLLMNIMFRMLQAGRCLLKRQVCRHIREPCGDICLQKYFGGSVECSD